ncbi:MAG: hypothetical protein DRJ03_31500 [Chloroflexi bacterium]|nr:MAG: hypothetical protein DRJ03_31500 [Chloroflexota bacterium]
MREKLLELSMMIVAAEEMARWMGKPTVAELKVRAEPIVRTEVHKLTNVHLPVKLMDMKGTGTLKEFLIRSKSPSYMLSISVDGKTLYNDDWDWFNEMGVDIGEITAYKTDEIYVLYLSDIKFSEGLVIEATPLAEGVKFEDVFMKLEVSVNRS